ncbi:zinc-dependent metalloprotease [Streptomyces flavofungini]|uniref:Zinc-dependent metalloprotease n=1 Tax=Streptomyces flavofungini TaxID=68200 RepID=A0ABS0X898_9ACTN|nr:zinc-dependent metalloprotease [Streptomyces flavofungini]MBJ3809221.1 zinc-dependent metalloprotease [Streptomyces flavofungini]
MTICRIRQETDLHPELTEQIGPIAEKVAPALEEVTGLRLGHILVRIVDHEAFIESAIEERRRVFARDAQDFDLSIEATRALYDRLETEESELRLSWMGGPAATVTNAAYEPEVLLVPEAFHHGGHGTEVITKALAHEFAHVAQHRASEGQVVIAYNTGRPDLRGFSDFAVGHLLHGHAEWADRQVTRMLLGCEVELGQPTGRETPQYLAMAKAFVERTQDPQTAPAHPAAPAEAYEEGLRWVTVIIDSLGLESFNRVWRHTRLGPTRREIKEPDVWVRRLARDIRL